MLAALGKKLPPVKGPESLWLGLSVALVVIGVTLGVFSAVRSGSLFIALGGALYTYVAYTRSANRRTIELLIPTGVTLLLFIVSLTLPHAK